MTARIMPFCSTVSYIPNPICYKVFTDQSRKVPHVDTKHIKGHLYYFITKYSPDFYKWLQVITSNWKIIVSDNTIHNVLGAFPGVVFKRSHNLKDIIEASNKLSTNRNRKSGMQRCGNCRQCHQIFVGKEIFLPSVMNRPYRIPSHFCCNTLGVVYLAWCKQCSAHYVRKIERALRKRVYGHMHDIVKKNRNNALFRHSVDCLGHEQFWFCVLEQVNKDPRGGVGAPNWSVRN